MTDEKSNIDEFIRYDAFGKSTNVRHDTLNKKQFTGKEIDEDSGLYYFLARYYDPDTGRFLSEDPAPNGNLYVYCDNNPINKVDPDGRLDLYLMYLLVKNAQDYGLIPDQIKINMHAPFGRAGLTIAGFGLNTSIIFQSVYGEYTEKHEKVHREQNNRYGDFSRMFGSYLNLIPGYSRAKEQEAYSVQIAAMLSEKQKLVQGMSENRQRTLKEQQQYLRDENRVRDLNVQIQQTKLQMKEKGYE
jgi:RHS repeat-associated protein